MIKLAEAVMALDKQAGDVPPKAPQAKVPTFKLNVPAEAAAAQRVSDVERRTALDRRAAGERGPVAAVQPEGYPAMPIGALSAAKPTRQYSLSNKVLSPEWTIEVLNRLFGAHER